MDKYEFNIKVEQIKKMAKVGDYSGAMKTADEIDWRRVSSVSLLTLISEIYEKNRDYAEAKEILLLAYEKAPIGKRLLYKLTMLALGEGNIPEAEAYYREFYDLAPDDSRQHILRYLILKAKGAPADQLINSLEQYTRDELDERWMYELAELYHEAGRSEECVAMCDKVMLMFGIGNYVDKAMDLKLNQEGCPLNEYQQDLISNRDKYEARLKDMEEHPDKYDPDADAVVVEKPENYDQENEPAIVVTEDAEEPVAVRKKPAHHEPTITAEETSAADEQDKIVKADVAAILGGAYISGNEGVISEGVGDGKAEKTEEAPTDKASEGQAQISKAPESKTPISKAPESKTPISQTAVIAAPIKEIQETEESKEVQGEEDEEMTIYTVNFIVERRKEEDGVNAAIRLLKLMHEHTGSHNQVAKIKAGKLNTLGVLASREKLAGKDLVIEQAGDLAYSIVEEVMELIKTEPTERVVVLIDNPMQIRKMLSAYPELLQLFHVDKEDDPVVQQTPQKEAVKKEAVIRETVNKEAVNKEAVRKEAVPVVRTTAPKKTADVTPTDPHDDYYEDYYEDTPAPAPVNTQAGGMTSAPAQRTMQDKMNEEMDMNDFANYAQEYAESIDCSISGKSKLALYERIELMEEDGIRLTRENAVALIEEAADKAEKKGLGSLFKAKYDKDDKLILREEHFVG